MNETIPQSGPAPGVKRRMRWWIPAAILALTAMNIVRIREWTSLDSMTQNMQTMFTGLVTSALLIIWWLFLTKLRWRTRLTGLGAAVICVVGLKQLVRIDGSVNGGGRPNIVWKWTPRKTGNIGEFKAVAKQRSQLDRVIEYPGYLGSKRSGVIEGLELDPDWAAHPPLELWRRPIGLGWSAFAVSGSSAITQEQRGERELTVCYDLATGNPVWSHTNLVRFSEPMGGDGPRATPSISGGRVYALGATGILDCLDSTTGKLIWTHDTLKENGIPNTYFGKCSSPLVADDLVIVTGGMTNGSTVLAFRCQDGTPAWQAGDDQASFSSPALVTLGGKRQILSINAASVAGYDPKDGTVIWKYGWANNKWPKCAQPVVLENDRVFFSASFSAGCVLLQVSTDAEGKASAKELWKNRNLKSEFSHIVSREGFIYGLDDGILTCIDASNGERKWKDGRYGHGQLLLVNDLLLVQTEQGPVVLVEANPSAYREVARLNALSSKTWNTPVLAGPFLLVRNDQEAVCYRVPERGQHQRVVAESAERQ